MIDSIKTLESPTAQRLHGTVSGKLHKGHTIVHHNSTIPTKYQTVVISNSDNKGFTTRARRFQYEMTENVNPSPVAYRGLEDPLSLNNPSLSKKGTGGFPSKAKRTLKLDMGCGIGPNRYLLPSHLQSRKDFGRSAAANFHPDIAVKRDKGGFGPGPSKYNLSDTRNVTGKENHVSAEAAFKSKSKREFMDLKEAKRKPGPTQYYVEKADSIMKAGERVPISSFKSTSQRKILDYQEDNPGPGAYMPHEAPKDDVKRLLFPMKHYLCLSAPALPLPPTPPGPGPGQYEMSSLQRPRHFMSSSVFLSNTSRWSGPGCEMGPASDAAYMPGPAQYHPVRTGKQSFLYNAMSKWV